MISAVCFTPRRSQCEIVTEFENTLACLSGAQMGLNHEKNGRRKSRDTLPLMQVPRGLAPYHDHRPPAHRGGPIGRPAGVGPPGGRASQGSQTSGGHAGNPDQESGEDFGSPAETKRRRTDKLGRDDRDFCLKIRKVGLESPDPESGG